MSHRVRILSISDDDGLRFSRELLLKNEGYETESMTSNAALSLSVSRSFDIALICRSVDPDRAAALTTVLRNHIPDIHVICVAPIHDDTQPREAAVEISPGPEPLLEAIRLICGQMTAPQRMA